MAFAPTEIVVVVRGDAATFRNRYSKRVTALRGSFGRHSPNRGRQVRMPWSVRSMRLAIELIAEFPGVDRIQLLGLPSEFSQWMFGEYITAFNPRLFVRTSPGVGHYEPLAETAFQYAYRIRGLDVGGQDVSEKRTHSEKVDLLDTYFARIESSYAKWESEELPKIHATRNEARLAQEAVVNLKAEALENLRWVLSQAGCTPSEGAATTFATTRLKIADLEFEVRIVDGSERRVVEDHQAGRASRSESIASAPA